MWWLYYSQHLSYQLISMAKKNKQLIYILTMEHTISTLISAHSTAII
ncbi:hypothetical protein [Citrobacter pasteurii]|nr:hypothetical protein [Citrobacter pasteurii]